MSIHRRIRTRYAFTLAHRARITHGLMPGRLGRDVA